MYRIFERILAKRNIDAFNGAQGRLLYVPWIYRRGNPAV